MASETSIPTKPAKTGFRWKRWLVGALLAIVVLIVGLGVFLRLFGYDLAKKWLESPAGPRVAGKAVGKAIKVYGEFAPMTLDNWTIHTASFTSEGWPGEAIGSLDGYGVVAVFNPNGLLHGAYQFTSINLDTAVIRLDKPDNAIKLHPVKLPPPWYAIFMPNRFECGPIICPHSDVKFAFQGTEAGIKDANIQADLIGKNLKYHATSGLLDFPYIKPLNIQKLDMFVTSEAITIYDAELVGTTEDPTSRLSLSGRVGQHADKSIDAQVSLNDISIEKILPEDLRDLIHGKISGDIKWHRNATGDDITSEGDLNLNGATLDNLSVFKELSQLHNNPDLQDFVFDVASAHYTLHNGVLTMDMKAHAEGKFDMTGTVTYDRKTKVADLDLVFSQLPLKTWLPPDFKSRYSGFAGATLKWHGQLSTIKDSNGTIGVNLDGTHISNPILLRKFLNSKGFRAPEEIDFQTAQFTFSYADEVFKLQQANLVAPGVLNAQLSGAYEKGSDLTARMDWQGLNLGTWLPEKYAKTLSGNLDGHVTLGVKQWKFGDGSYGGEINLLDGALYYTKIQSALARFLDQRALLKLPLTRTQLSWTWDHGAMTAKDIDIRCGNDIGVKGNMFVDGDNKLTGTLWIGAKADYLKWLPDAQTTVFKKKDEDLYWAKIKLSGTLKKPGQDFGDQVMAQLKKHPDAIIALGGKLLSWYIGDWFGAAADWQRPQGHDVQVSGPSKK